MEPKKFDNMVEVRVAFGNVPGTGPMPEARLRLAFGVDEKVVEVGPPIGAEDAFKLLPYATAIVGTMMQFIPGFSSSTKK